MPSTRSNTVRIPSGFTLGAAAPAKKAAPKRKPRKPKSGVPDPTAAPGSAARKSKRPRDTKRPGAYAAPKVYTVAEVERMTREQLTEAINDEAVALLKMKSARSTAGIPFDGSDTETNPYALALLDEPPREIYVKENVWQLSLSGKAHVFKPWVWRLSTTTAMNRYADRYDKVNPDEPFPREAFRAEIDRVRGMGYKRIERASKPAQQK